jgi:hypothetical protein
MADADYQKMSYNAAMIAISRHVQEDPAWEGPKYVPTAAQLNYLKEHAAEFFEAFVNGDPWLIGATCGCCKEKEALLRKLWKVGLKP